MSNSNRFNNINDLNQLRANTLGRIEAAVGYGTVSAENPQESVKEILDDYYNRKEELEQ